MLLIRLIGRLLDIMLNDLFISYSMTSTEFVWIQLFSAQLTKAYQTANVLFEVLKAVNMTQSMEVDREVIFFLRF